MIFASATSHRELFTDRIIAAIRKRKLALSSSRADCLFSLHRRRLLLHLLLLLASSSLHPHDVEAMLLSPPL
jgi:hypothetical protein